VAFNGETLLSDKIYDVNGRIVSVSDSYFSGTMPQWTTTDYDVVDRPTRAISPGNRQSTISYSGLTTTAANALNQQTIAVVDTQGHTVSVTDAQSNVLTHKYDGFGNLIEIRDAAGNVTSITYDLGGKRTQIVDPDTGATNFTYDALGQLLTQNDARGQTAQKTYDKLGRLISQQSPEGISTWTFDTAPNGIGKLSRVNGPSGYQESYAYDTLGRVISVTTTINGESFVTTRSYDLYGRPNEFTYPTGLTVQNICNAQGYLSQIRRSDTGLVLWQANTQNVKGQTERLTLGNGLVTQKTYDPTTGFLQSIQTGSVQQLSFQFNALGNLTQRKDVRLNLQEDFQYDILNRLTRSLVAGLDPVTISYDRLGNILTKSDTGTYSYLPAHPHAVTSIVGPRGNTYTYDAAGNRTTSAQGIVTYSSSSKPVSIINGATEMRFTLNPTDVRVKEKTYISGTVVKDKTIVGSTFERIRVGTSVEDLHYVNGPEGPVAIVSRKTGALENTKYLLLDHLGSIQTVTNESAAIQGTLSFDSWGNRRDSQSWQPAVSPITSVVDRGFTGHEHLDAVSLIHMNGRVYDPVTGRFLSADPYVQEASNMQCLNRS